MKDPLDNQTLDLVEEAARPLTGAERQRRRREKLKKLREAGRLFDLQLTAEELDAIRAALSGYADRNPGQAMLGDVAESLWRRLTCVRVGRYYEGDPVWSREAIKAEAERVRALLAAAPCAAPSADDLALSLLSARDRELLELARRNESLVRAN